MAGGESGETGAAVRPPPFLVPYHSLRAHLHLRIRAEIHLLSGHPACEYWRYRARIPLAHCGRTFMSTRALLTLSFAAALMGLSASSLATPDHLPPRQGDDLSGL